MNRLCIRDQHERKNHRGSIVVMTAVMMIVLMGFMAFAIDLGYMYMARAQMQRAADAAAIAGAWELVAEEERLAGDGLSTAVYQARVFADEYAKKNKVGDTGPSLGESDVTVGYRGNIFDKNEPISLLGSDLSNTVRVKVQRTGQQNGEVPLFFAKLMGHDSIGLQAEATAALLTNIKGFKCPSDGCNLQVLPFALDVGTAALLKANRPHPDLTNDWTYDGTVATGGDNTYEANLYPQGTGSPGNRGTVDIGSSNNSTADISRQITDGLSEHDLADYPNQSLCLNEYGVLELNADTGISAGFKDELESIIGEERIIPIFESISGNGNNATYAITGWMGVVILDVKLTGPMKGKKVTIQPTCVNTLGAIPADAGIPTSNFIFSPVVLVQ